MSSSPSLTSHAAPHPASCAYPVRRTACLLVFMLLAAGCQVQRTITINSQPSGALVWLNDQEVGRTPVTVPFTFYGTYDVRLEHENAQPLWTKQKAKAPWWEAPGLDLLVMPLPNKRVDLHWRYTLDAIPMVDGVPTLDEEALVQRASQMRSLTRQQPDRP